jgi:hypothetical protein
VEEQPPGLSDRVLAAIELSQTPEQQDVARDIFDQLMAGAEVDDVKPLIDRMVRVVAVQRREKQAEE